MSDEVDGMRGKDAETRQVEIGSPTYVPCPKCGGSCVQEDEYGLMWDCSLCGGLGAVVHVPALPVYDLGGDGGGA